MTVDAPTMVSGLATFSFTRLHLHRGESTTVCQYRGSVTRRLQWGPRHVLTAGGTAAVPTPVPPGEEGRVFRRTVHVQEP